jgi:hypothetical protein
MIPENFMHIIQRMFLLMVMVTITACGGGGSAPAPTNSVPMKLILSLQGSSAATVKAFSITIALPSGVTVQADATGMVISPVTTTIGSATGIYPVGKYVPAIASAKAELTIDLASVTTLTAGDVMVLNVDVAAGTTAPAASAFTVVSSVLKATGGVDVSATSSLTLR